MKKAIPFIFIFCLVFAYNCQAQFKTPANEVTLFSFQTASGKIVSINKAKDDSFLVYRFGDVKKIDFEFPQQKDSTSFKKFTYSNWIRGSGNSKSALDLKYLTFENEGFKYIVYDIYFEEDNSHSIGVRVMNLATQEISDIKGKRSTQKGSLDVFRDDDHINQSNAAYD